MGWAPLNERMSRITTVCAYDRAGMGYSEPVDHVTPAEEVARNLHKLTASTHVRSRRWLLPLIALSEGRPNIPFMQEHLQTWFELQEELAQLSTNGQHIVATESAHAIHRTEPDLILDSVQQVVSAARGVSR